ncbi:hypothetical protein V6N11_022544 [Hibiscus sabdariffa]|uniref:Uncharacterized protein n=1 Tax=Hibiscus sabdariffa TaxID=183260 RepID=A0ABR2TK95_9ROSI
MEEAIDEEPPMESELPKPNMLPIVQGRIRRENRRAPEWHKDYVSGAELDLSNEDEEVKNLVLYASVDPITFEEASLDLQLPEVAVAIAEDRWPEVELDRL